MLSARMTPMIRPLDMFLAFLLLALLPASPGWAEPPTKEKAKALAANEELRQELLRRFREDQEARNEFLKWMKSHGSGSSKQIKELDTPENSRVRKVDAANTARMKEIIAQYGWPGTSLVGSDGANAAWLLIQHADADVPLQKQCLALLERAARKGEASKTNLAYLTDRVLVAEKKKQRYGTQMQQQGGKWVPHPVEDEASLDKRRAEVGLPAMAEYIKMMEKMYGAAEKK
jgi:hypothetical protein